MVVLFVLYVSEATAIYPYLHTLSLHDALPISGCRRLLPVSAAQAGTPTARPLAGTRVVGSFRPDSGESARVVGNELPEILATPFRKLKPIGKLFPRLQPRRLYHCRIFRFSRPPEGLRLGNIRPRSEEHTSELQSLMRISYAVFCLKKKNRTQ